MTSNGSRFSSAASTKKKYVPGSSCTSSPVVPFVSSAVKTHQSSLSPEAHSLLMDKTVPGAMVSARNNTLTSVLREITTLIKDEKICNVKMEFTNCVGVVHTMLEHSFLANDVRDRLEKYTIDPEFDTSYFAKKALVVIFNTTFSEFFNVDKREL